MRKTNKRYTVSTAREEEMTEKTDPKYELAVMRVAEHKMSLLVDAYGYMVQAEAGRKARDVQRVRELEAAQEVSQGEWLKLREMYWTALQERAPDDGDDADEAARLFSELIQGV